MLVNVKCSKCGESTKIDIGDKTKEEVEKYLEMKGGFECYGYHVEFGKRSNFWTIDWDSIQEGSSPTEEQFLIDLRNDYKEVYKNQEIGEKYKVTGFSCGMCMVQNKETGKGECFDFASSPKGERYYFK